MPTPSSARILLLGDTPVAAYTDPLEANQTMRDMREKLERCYSNCRQRPPALWCYSVAVNPTPENVERILGLEGKGY